MIQTGLARALHQEHMATLALLERLERLLGRNGPANVPDAASPAVRALLGDLERAVAREIGPHFAFEEAALFPMLRAAGEQEMVALLSGEHRTLDAAAADLATQAGVGRMHGFAAAAWARFHAAAGTLVAGLSAHVEKEEMGMLPALDAMLDPEADAALMLTLATHG